MIGELRLNRQVRLRNTPPSLLSRSLLIERNFAKALFLSRAYTQLLTSFSNRFDAIFHLREQNLYILVNVYAHRRLLYFLLLLLQLFFKNEFACSEKLDRFALLPINAVQILIARL